MIKAIKFNKVYEFFVVDLNETFEFIWGDNIESNYEVRNYNL